LTFDLLSRSRCEGSRRRRFAILIAGIAFSSTVYLRVSTFPLERYSMISVVPLVAMAGDA
jgi:hypothetical protein